ncbi:MAG: MurT ligase domain-containing protein [Erysipelotrichaceae bacterium]|nr:MurT ligase domain-containing protein [Erysipelotrichaceae bacterium]MCD8574160.1 MurT ligase domain-containing protein [Erysipelotrichaceae bacterium]
MKQTLRFFIALWASKSIILLMRLLKRNATHFPGDVALKIDPNFLSHVSRPSHVIMITGTNGKTSVTNMILDVFAQDKIAVIHNALGSNILQGITSSMIEGTTLTNKSKHEWAILEVDERSSRLMMPYLKPDYVIVNNLFRDSYRRNAHVEFIIGILQNSIPETAHVIVNGDDMFATQVIQQRKHTIFSLQPISDEVTRQDSRIHDGQLCPQCFHPMTFTFVRYHHLSHYYCPQCGNTNRNSDVVAMLSSIKSKQLHLNVHNQTYVVDREVPSVNDAYNTAAVFALFNALGNDLALRSKQLSSIKVVSSRFSEMMVKNKRIVGLLAKDQNPVANSRLCDFLSTQPQWGRLGLCFMNEVHAHEDHPHEVENMAYLYDTDFEYLKESHITQFMLGGHRRYEFRARLIMAGCDPQAMVMVEKEEDEIDKIDLNQVDTIVLMYSTKNIPEGIMLREKLITRIQKEVV